MANSPPLIRRVLDEKREIPSYQQMDYEPPMGGRSLLHDEHGLPRVTPAPNKGDIPIMNEISNEQMFIQAVQPEDMPKPQIVTNPSQIRRGLPKKAEQMKDSDFIPPRDNFVSVGQVEQSWYNEKVTGVPDEPEEKKEFVDNNEEVNVDALQGLPEVDNEIDVSGEIAEAKRYLDGVRKGAAQGIAKVSNMQELASLKGYVLGNQGPIANMARKIGQVHPRARPTVGEMLNEAVAAISEEIDVAAMHFGADDEYKGADADVAREADTEPAPEKQEENVVKKEASKQKHGLDALMLAEGQFAIYIDNEIIETTNNPRKTLETIVLKNDIAIDRVTLIKRVPIDFGILIKD